MQVNAEAALAQAQISSASLEAQVSSLREKVRQLEHQLEHLTAEEAQKEVMLEQQKKLRLTLHEQAVSLEAAQSEGSTLKSEVHRLKSEAERVSLLTYADVCMTYA